MLCCQCVHSGFVQVHPCVSPLLSGRFAPSGHVSDCCYTVLPVCWPCVVSCVRSGSHVAAGVVLAVVNASPQPSRLMGHRALPLAPSSMQ